MKRTIVLCFFLFLVINPFFGQDYVQIIKSSVNIRFSPTTSSSVIAQANNGNIFNLEGEKVDWYEISMFSGEYRYIYKSMCKKVNYTMNLPESEQIRKAVFKALLNAEDKAQAEADRKYPNDIFKNIDYQRMLDDKYKLKVIDNSNLQPPIYRKLIIEGVQKKWVQ